jgi:hypothetical protein
MTVSWVAGIEEGAETVVRRRTELAWWGPEAAAAFWRLECRKVMGKRPGSFYA